tara:strand:+ start:118 stop:735 length:618 start_codon:yes stop_codon:yes gene_type:complete
MKKIRLWKSKDELSDKYALVDDEDYERIVETKDKRGKPKKWYCHNNNTSSDYAMSSNRRDSIHRLVMGNPKGMCVDHINGDTLDNRKENLRVCTISQNSQNKRLKSHSQSGYKGVHEKNYPIRKKYVSKKTGKVTYHEHLLTKRFQAYIGSGIPNTPSIKLGYYATAEEAAEVRDKKALEIHGEFARLNFPDKREQYLEEINRSK